MNIRFFFDYAVQKPGLVIAPAIALLAGGLFSWYKHRFVRSHGSSKKKGLPEDANVVPAPASAGEAHSLELPSSLPMLVLLDSLIRTAKRLSDELWKATTDSAQYPKVFVSIDILVASWDDFKRIFDVTASELSYPRAVEGVQAVATSVNTLRQMRPAANKAFNDAATEAVDVILPSLQGIKDGIERGRS